MKLFFGLVLLASATSATAGKSQQAKVDVDGVIYRVKVTDKGTLVVNKSLVVVPTPWELDQRRKAVVMVTGCQLENALLYRGALVGSLKCPEGVPPTVKASSPNMKP
ncbi:hypothetical protein [Sphingobium olei]|uniref:Uncharacterized protein n=1 Tax=Sphingobium olei TaxID=420955 RepID=A0ABW3NX78_9SPHN|nr:hypothetical protein [Sphingobium sp.]